MRESNPYTQMGRMQITPITMEIDMQDLQTAENKTYYLPILLLNLHQETIYQNTTYWHIHVYCGNIHNYRI